MPFYWFSHALAQIFMWIPLLSAATDLTKCAAIMVNSADPDQTLPSEKSDLNLNCMLSMSPTTLGNVVNYLLETKTLFFLLFYFFFFFFFFFFVVAMGLHYQI